MTAMRKFLTLFFIFFFSLLPLAGDLTEQEVSFQNGEVALSGTIILDEGKKGQRPAILFVPGSGPGPRDLFRKQAGFYASQGFVTLIYDKRGSGKSAGRWQTSSLGDLAGDVVAGLEFLQSRPEVSAKKIGVFGVSQGGWVIPVAAGKTGIPSFGIIISGGGAAPRDVETAVYKGALAHSGADESQISEALTLLEGYFSYLATGEGFEALGQAIEAAKARPWYPAMRLGDILPSPENRANWAWVANYHPAPDIAALNFPVLVMLGDSDFLAPVTLTEPAWRDVLKGPAPEFSKVIVFEGAGHGLIRGGHGEVFGANQEFVEGYFETQMDWLEKIGIIGHPGLF